MARYVALLRGVGGPRQTPSTELRQIGVELGYSDVSTYIATGNLLFRSDRTAAALRKELYPVLRDRFGFDIPVLVVSHRTIGRVMAENPFADSDPARVSVTFLDRPLPAAARAALEAASAQEERLELGGPTATWLYADLSRGQPSSKLTRALLSPMRGVVSTSRNMRTTAALHSRLGG